MRVLSRRTDRKVAQNATFADQEFRYLRDGDSIYSRKLSLGLMALESPTSTPSQFLSETADRNDKQTSVQSFARRTTLVHNGVMASKEKSIRQSVTLPAKVATQVRSMAKRRRLSANRMLVELVEEGIVAKKEKEKAFFELAERFRSADDPKEVERLGEELGQMVFGR